MTEAPGGPGRFASLAAEILADGTIDFDDVLNLRQGIYKDGVVGHDEAELMFYLNDHSRNNDESWNIFFVEAMSDYFLHRQIPEYVIGDAEAEFLIDRAMRNGRLDKRTESDLIIEIIRRAERCPDRLVELGLAALKTSVLEGNGVLFGRDRRRPGVIDAADVEAVRKVVYGTGGEGGFSVSRREADLLFDLNEATRGKDNAPAWQDLFVKAITMYLLFSGGSPERVDHGEAQWLVGRIGDGPLDPNEAALLAYLRQETESIDPLLDPLMARLEE